MLPFDFQPRTRIVFETGALSRIGQIARDLGFRRTLLVADRGIVEAGHAGAAARFLETSRIDVSAFSDFGENPDSAMVEAGRRFAAALDVDSIVGLGGG